MKIPAFSLLFLCFIVTACGTVEGFKGDLNRLASRFTEVPDKKEQKRKLPVYDGVCPSATLGADLDAMSSFTDDSKPGAGSLLSEVTVTDITNTCRVENGSIVMEIALSLYGHTGPKARIKPSDKPSFAYPYFVAVTDAAGTVLSKEIFAATLFYDSGQNETRKTESIFQNMPIPAQGTAESYKIVIGFQLSEAQLAYNRTIPKAPR